MTNPDAAADLVSQYRQVAEAAPDDIKADWNRMADGLEAFANMDMEDEESMAALAEFEDLAEVGPRLQESVTSECS
jgi:hypothetical protein